MHAWVIMSNPIHLIVSTDGKQKLSDVLRDFKKFTSTQILKSIEENTKKSRKLLQLMKTIILFTAVIIGCFACQEKQIPKTAEELRAELKISEQSEPGTYLKDTLTTLTEKKKIIQKGGLFKKTKYAHDGYLLKASIINSATLATYKDVQVTIEFYSVTETLMASETYTIYKLLPPQKTTTISTSFKEGVLPESYDSFTMYVTGASVVFND
jgi:hypothetical protein